MNPLEELIKNLTPLNACLLGEGYDNRLEYLKHLMPLEILEFKSGTPIGTWTVPDEWIVREAWVKNPKGEKIIDYAKEPMSLVVGSLPEHAHMELNELRKHWHYSEDDPEAVPYVFKYYDKDWGFCVPKLQVRRKLVFNKQGEIVCEDGLCLPALKDFDPSVGKVQIEGIDYTPKYEDALEEGDYEVFIDTEYVPGVMKLGVHTIPGVSEREILLFAHLDHPFQANDNLSAVACLVDLATKIKCEHTVKIIFCPETIGSNAYALTQDLSKVDFMIAVDACGNENTLMMQKPWDMEHRIYRVAHVAIQGMGQSYRQGMFRNSIGSDEYAFNDPLIGIPGLLLSRWPYNEYHTNKDKPEIIKYQRIKETGEAILKIIEIWEKDYIPVRKWKGPLMRSRYKIQTESPQVNLSYDYFFYSMDGKRSLAALCCEYGLNFDYTYQVMEQLSDDKVIRKKKIK